jgi:hypothetical protein
MHHYDKQYTGYPKRESNHDVHDIWSGAEPQEMRFFNVERVDIIWALGIADISVLQGSWTTASSRN